MIEVEEKFKASTGKTALQDWHQFETWLDKEYRTRPDVVEALKVASASRQS